MMNEIITFWGQWMLATSWQLVVIITVVGALCFFWRKAPVRMVHLLWLLVFIKLLVPPQLGHDYSLANLLVRSEIFTSQQVAVSSEQEQWQVPAAHVPMTAIEGPITIADKSVMNDNEIGSSLSSTSVQEFPIVSGIWQFTYQHILFVLWLVGAAGLLLRSLMSARRFRGWLSTYGQPPPSWFKDKLAEWSQKVGLRKPPGCVIVPGSHCPCLFGWFKPQLLFPEELLKRLTPEQLQMAAYHELTHIRGRDTIMNGLQSLLQIIYWFHPLVWLAGRQVRHYREMVVDEAVVSAHKNLPKHTYEQTILALAEQSPARPVPAMVGILEHRSFVFRRVMRLVASSSKRIGWQCTLLSWVMLALFTFFLIPMGISQPQVSPSGTLNVEKKAFPEVLNEPQRLYMQWTEEKFSGYLDRSEFADLSDSTKAELEERWIKILEGPWSAKYYDTINCLAAIRSQKAVKPLLHIAAERREKDNRDRWMAVRALGIVGDESVVPELIHLIYHYNQNTRFWAQISLARITGVNFGYDWQKWGEWWNQQGKLPPFSPEKITWTTSYPEWADPQKQKESDREFIEKFSGTKKEESAAASPAPKQATEAGAFQEEIDKAKSGGVVIVPPGKHEGSLEITKPLTLRGEDARMCTIELLGNEPTITIRGTKDVVLENLTVRWAPKSTDVRIESPAAIYVRDSDVVIRGCSLEPIERPKTTPYAIMAAGRTNVTFTEGRSTGFAYALIFLEGANGTVSNSILTDAGHSVVTMHANSHVKIIGNILGRCEYHAVRNTGGTMDMMDNLVIADNRAGAYLGNKSAHGRIANNLFSENRGALWAYAESDVVIENNIFYAENGPGVGFQDTCNLTIRRNSFINNAQGLTKYSKEGRPPGIGARTNGNHYWNNKEDFVDFEKETSALYGDPKFTDPSNGDFSPKKGSPLLDDEGNPLAGLTDPKPIRALWATWTTLNQ